MTASSECKARSINLAELSRRAGKRRDGRPLVSIETLNNWYRDKRVVFDALLNHLAPYDLSVLAVSANINIVTGDFLCERKSWMNKPCNPIFITWP